MACGILVHWPGIELRPWAVRVWNPKHWTATEFPGMYFVCSTVYRSFNLKLLIYLSLEPFPFGHRKFVFYVWGSIYFCFVHKFICTFFFCSTYNWYMVFGVLWLTSLSVIILRSIHVSTNGCQLGPGLSVNTVTLGRARAWVLPECPCPHSETQLPPQETLKTCRWVWPRPLWSCCFDLGPSACETLCVLPKSGVPVLPLPVDSSPADHQSQMLWGLLLPMPEHPTPTPTQTVYPDVGLRAVTPGEESLGYNYFPSWGSPTWWVWDLIIPWKYPNFLPIEYSGFYFAFG